MARKHDYPQVVADYESGLSLMAVGKKHGTTASTVLRILRRSGKSARDRDAMRPRGERHFNWRGGKNKTSDGYVQDSNQRRIHRLALETAIGRRLKRWEAVHHVDGDKTNYALFNLVVIPWREHTRFHSFLSHRGLLVNRTILEAVCRRQSEFVFRFTKREFYAAARAFLLPGGQSVRRKLKSLCSIRGCANTQYGRGLCSKHWQRKRARDRGFWIAGGGRRAAFIQERVCD